MKKYLRFIIACILVLGVALLAKGGVVWAGQGEDLGVASVSGQADPLPRANSGLGSVKPPPAKGAFCQNGFYSVGGVVTLGIEDLQPGYCIEAELWNPTYKANLIPEEAGKTLAHSLFIKVYYHGELVEEILPGDGIVEACYAIPPEKDAQFYFYDYYWKRFETRTEPPETWDPFETQVDDDTRVACAFTHTSGLYALVGK